MSSPDALIVEVEKSLLALHRRFLELERRDYERSHGLLLNPFEFLKLLTSHRDFAWLRPMSLMMADIDSRADRQSTYKNILDALNETEIQSLRERHKASDQEFAKLNQEFSLLMAKLLP